MIVFLYGPETFLSKRKLNQIVAKKTEKSAGFNVYRLDGNPQAGGIDLLELKEVVEKISIFETKKIIVLENIFKSDFQTLEEMEKFVLSKNLREDPNNLLIFWGGDIDQKKEKTAFFKLLTKKPAISQKFENLGSGRLKKWISREIQARAGKISPAALESLSLILGKDLWRLDREIDKLIAYRNGGTISADDVRLLVAADVSSNIFDLIDALGRKDRSRALSIFYGETKTGRDELEILGLIAGHFRKLISVRSMIDLGQVVSVSSLGFHPYVFQKVLNQSRNFSLSDLKNKFKKIAETDFFIKTGKIDKRAGLEMLIFSLGV